jgi:hypothetical protein
MTCSAEVCPEYQKYVAPKDERVLKLEKDLKTARDLVDCMPGMQKRIEELENLLRQCADDMKTVAKARENLDYSLEKIPDKTCDILVWTANMKTFMALMRLDNSIQAVAKMVPDIEEEQNG